MAIKKNLGGRPKGSRNKLNAEDEIKKALNRGAGLVELKQFLWDRMIDEGVSDNQKNKFLDKYWELIKFVHSANLKLETSDSKPSQEKEQKEIQKGEYTSENKPNNESTNVARISFSKKAK